MRGRSALLVNTNSRRVRKDPTFLPRLQETFGNRGLFLATRNPSELSSAMSEIRKLRPDLFFLCGGDGTLRQTLTELIRSYTHEPLPKIAILKAGTMNTVARGLGIRRPALPQFRWILERCDRGLPLPSILRHPLNINDGYGFIFAIGGFSRFIERYNADADPTPFRGFSMLVRVSLSSLFRGPYARSMFVPFSATLLKDGRPIPISDPVTTVSASAIRHIGFGFRPYAQAEGPAGEFGVLIVGDSPRALLYHLGAFRRAKPIRSRSLYQAGALELSMSADSEVSPMVDGDILAPRKEFALRAGPAVDFVTE